MTMESGISNMWNPVTHTLGHFLRSLDIIPKLNGNPLCLTWALKGECSHGCRRANQHVRYNRSTNQAIHALMDTCGVAAIQP